MYIHFPVMKKYIVKVLFIALVTIKATVAFAQTDTEFWFCIPEISSRHETDVPKVCITTLEAPATVIIDMPSNPAFTPIVKNIPANTTDITNFPLGNNNDNIYELGRTNDLVPGKDESCQVTKKGMRIRATALITAYLQRGDTKNLDIWALKGSNALGTIFIVPSQNHYDNYITDVPGAYNSIDIVATERTTITVTIKQSSLVYGWGIDKPTKTFQLNAGETLTLRAASNRKDQHLGGTIIASSGKIAVQWKDDSLKANHGSCYDVIGDQLVPTSLAGKEFIVCRGKLAEQADNQNTYNNYKSSEYVYIVSTEDNTKVEFKTSSGGNTISIPNTTIKKRGDMHAVCLNNKHLREGDQKNYDYLYIKSNKPVLVMHITGFGCEMGGAIIPTINGCTGSTSVSAQAGNGDKFLSIMTKKAHIGDFTITIGNRNYPLPEKWFDSIPGTGWCYLNRAYNCFSRTHNQDGVNIPAIGNNQVFKVTNNTGLFHLGIINGGSNTGCLYGYFSDFSNNFGKAVTFDQNTTESDYTRFCAGDTIKLVASGGIAYKWIYYSETHPQEYTFLSEAERVASSPMVSPPPGINRYQVTITRACYLGTNVDTVIDVRAYGYDPITAKFDLDQLSQCSPAQVVLDNKTQNASTYSWTLCGPDTTMSMDKNYGADTLTFVNEGKSNNEYELTLVASKSYNCPETYSAKFIVCPSIVAKLDTAQIGSKCQPINVNFLNNSTGPYTRIYIDYGDGTTESYQGANIPTQFIHKYNNPSIKDTIYKAKIRIIDEVNGSCESTDSVNILVHGLVKAQYMIDKTASCSPLVASFSNNTIGDPTRLEYLWSVGGVGNYEGTLPGPKEKKNFKLTYRNETGNTPITYDSIGLKVTYKAANGDVCVSSFGGRDKLTIYPALKVDYTVSPTDGCDSLPVTFTNTSSDLSADTQFKWYLGDGATDNSNGTFSHIYYHTQPQTQLYQTALAGENKYGCRDSIASNIIRVFPYLNPNFTIDKVAGCSPLVVNITNNTPNHADKTNGKFHINSGYEVLSGSLDGPYAQLKFTNTTGKKQKITITLTDNFTDPITNITCTKVYEKVIEIYPEITASIVADQPTVCDSTIITFKNNTKFTGTNLVPANYEWLFGDGTSTKTTTNADVKRLYQNNTGSTGTTPQIYTVALVASANGCSDTITTDINVFPKVVAAFSADNYNICAPSTVILKNASIGANTYKYSFSDATADKTTTTLADVSYPITNTNPNAIEAKKVTLTASNGSCTNSISKVFYAYPNVTPKLTLSTTSGCGPLDVTIDRSATTGANIYAIDFGDGVTDETGNAKVAHTFSNITGSDKTYTIKLTATNTLGCANSTTANVTVFPEVQAAFNYQKDTECSPMDVKMLNSSTNGTQFVWNFGDGSANETKNNKSVFTHNYTNTSADGNSITNYTIKMVAIDANHPACRDSITKVIQIYPKVIADFTTANAEGCSPLTTTFTNKSKGYGLTYKWNYNYDNAESAITDATHTHTFDNVAAQTRTYNVTLTATDANKCTSTKTLPVKAYPHVTADFTYVKDDVCTPYPVTFSYPTSALNGNKFEWDFGFDNQTAVKTNKSTFKHTFDNSELNSVKTYTITMRSTDTNTGCTDVTSQQIEVHPRLLPAFTQDVTEGCNPLTVNFTNQTTGMATYLWEFGDSQSSTSVDPTHLFNHYELSDQTYNVKLKTTQIATGCKKTIDRNITAYSFVQAKFGINETVGNANGTAATILGGCTPFDVTITDSSRLNPQIGTWSWDFGDGNTSNNRQPKNRIYTNTDNTAPLENKEYTISLVVTNDHGCSDKTAQKIAVYPRSVPNFTGDFAGCHPHTVTFIDSSIVDSKSQYQWLFSDGSTIVNQPPFSKTFHNYDYVNNKTYQVKLRTTTEYSCTDSITKEITVYAKPLANFTPLVDRACPPFNAEFKNNSIGNTLTNHWNFGNGQTENTTSMSNRFVAYNNNTNDPITNNVELITESLHGCLDTMVNPMITFPNVIVDFDYETAGCSPHTINVKNLSTPTVTNHLWEFGDGSTSVTAEPTFTYYNTTNNDQVMTITYVGSSKYECYDTIQKQVTVYINPNVDFVAHAPSQRYPDDTVYFENYTQDGPWTYAWDFGDGNKSDTSAKYFMYKYGRWGANEVNNIFHVTLHVYSEHCQNTASHDVTILPPYPKIAIKNNRPAGCVPLTVDFAINQEFCNTFFWEFEDGSTSTEAEPTHTFTEPGIYNVKLTAEGDGGSHYDYEIITVHELPQPDFTAAPTFVMLPNQPVQFFNSTKNGNTYVWDFGDNTYSTDQNPIHQYTAEGVYDVKLIAYSSYMCADSITETQKIEVSGAGSIKFPNAFIPTVNSPTEGTYPEPDDINNVFHPVWFGVKDYELWVYNRWGEQLFYSNDITIGWNGRYANNGKELGQDVYFWKAKGKFENNTPFKIAGDVTLIRK